MDRDSVVISREFDGCRLDRALALCRPDLGLRGRRRLWSCRSISVDGRPAQMAFKVRAGQRIDIGPELSGAEDPEAGPANIVVAARDEHFAAVVKPAGLHCQSLPGKDRPALEDLLLLKWPHPRPLMLNRLDLPVSGLVLITFEQRRARLFREWEEAGQVEKRYMAWLDGLLEHEICVDRAIDSANRKRVKVLPGQKADPLRRTWVRPLRPAPDRKGTLAEILIHKGARHQIRAHLAYSGHPIRGDRLYGQAGDTEAIYLHHRQISLPGFFASYNPWFWPDFDPEQGAAACK